MIQFLFIIFLSPTYTQIFRPVQEKDGMVLYRVPVSALKYSCGKERPDSENLWGAIETRQKPVQTWVFRRPTDEDRCERFLKTMKSITAKYKEIEIMGYDKHGETLHFGFVRGKDDCHEWFIGDCKKF